MSGTTKVLTFSEGVSVSAPSQSFLSASNIQVYADDAAYVSAKGSAATDGNCYYNSTTDLIRYYSNGAWSSLTDDDSVQSISNKSFIDSTTTFEDNADSTRKVKFELSGVSPSTTRTITIPDVDITPVGVANNETISGTKTFSAITTFSNTTDSSSKDTGGVILEGGLGVEKNVYIGGNLVVKGTTTSIESTTLDVTDANITVNKGGNQAAADDVAGLTVEMSDATHAKILFDKDATSKFKVGAAGSEKEIATISDSQTFTNKTLTSPSMTSPTVTSGGETIAEIATPATPSSGYMKIYPKNDGNVYKLNSAGVESLIGSTGSTLTATTITATGGAQSTSTSTGDIQVSGGVGIVKDVFIGGKVNIDTAGTVIKGITGGTSIASSYIGEIVYGGAISTSLTQASPTSGTDYDIGANGRLTLGAGIWQYHFLCQVGGLATITANGSAYCEFFVYINNGRNTQPLVCQYPSGVSHIANTYGIANSVTMTGIVNLTGSTTLTPRFTALFNGTYVTNVTMTAYVNDPFAIRIA